jgi:hypothetical protein
MSTAKITVTDGAGKVTRVEVIATGGGEPDPDRVITKNEKFYDEKVAPVLSKLAKQCVKRKMAFGAHVEFNPGETGRTSYPTEEMSLQTELVLMAMKCKGNIDALIRGYEQACQRKGIDLAKESIYIRLANRE